MTPDRAQPSRCRKPDTLRSLRAGAVWGALPARDQHLLLWLMAGDIVTAQLASLLVYGPLRIAQRRLSRLVDIGLLRGFWTASAQRPHGRYAYVLTRAARIEIERLQWPEGRPDRPAELPPSAPIHQLATHDLFGAFLRAADPALPEGIFAWLPERACGQLFGFLRADALAGIRVADRTLTMFIERDLGTERGEVIAEKVRRYRSLFARAPEGPIVVGFVVESARRASTIQSLAGRYATAGLSFVTVVTEQARNDPLGARWSDGETKRSIRELVGDRASAEQTVLTPGCLLDAEVIGALDDRGAAMFPTLMPYLRS